MLAVTFESKRVVVSERPEPGGSDVLVRVRACGICGSDLTILDSGFPIRGIPGHEIAGELPDGTPVAIEPLAPCGRCRYCIAGDYQVCPEHPDMIFGIGRDGGMAEWLRVPARCLVPLPRSLDARTGFLVEPLAVAIHALRRAGVAGGDRVLVIGAGSIGLCSVVAAAAAGAQVDLVARHPAQIEAGERLGARIVGSEGAEEYAFVLDCAGSASATTSACEALRPNGTLLMLAPSWETIELPGLLVLAKELDLVVSKMYGRAGSFRDVDAAAGILGSRPEVADALVTHRFALADAAAAFETARDRKSGAIKVVLEP
ncbi:MAG TPA: alcohol dehydrogenase, partial [Deltaproteobacteria bacterium]|nr:alcohol dehydrogenase [Deltaproteobacteria bacterium]